MTFSKISGWFFSAIYSILSEDLGQPLIPRYFPGVSVSLPSMKSSSPVKAELLTTSLTLEDHDDLMELPQAPCISFWDLTLGLWIAPGLAWGKRKWALQLSTIMSTAWTWGGCQEEACSQNLQQTDPRRFERWPNPPGLRRRPEFFDVRSPEVVETWLWRQCF